jgi:hypothetical protein
MLAHLDKYTDALRFGRVAGLPAHGWFWATAVGMLLGLTVLIDSRLAPLLALALLALPILLTKPILMCYALILITVLTSGLVRGRFIPVITPNELALIAFFGLTLLLQLVHKPTNQSKPSKTSYYGIAAAILLVGGTMILPVALYRLHNVPLNLNNAFKLLAPVQYFLLFYIFYKIPQKRQEVNWILGLMLVGGVLVALVGLLQATGWGAITSLLRTLYASSHTEASLDGAGRITSLLGAWNALGMFLATCILLGWTMLPRLKQEHPLAHWATLGAIALCFLCLLASGSFAGLLGVVIGLALIELWGKRGTFVWPYLLLLGVGILLALLLFQGILWPLLESRIAYQYRHGGMLPQTFAQRLLLWDEIFIPAIRRAFPWPVYPVVPDTFLWHTEESQYLYLLFRMGLIGFVGFMGWLGLTFVWLWRGLQGIRRENSALSLQHDLILFALALLSVLTISGLTNAVFTYAGTIDYFWMILGLIAAGNNTLSNTSNKVI